MSDGGEKYRWTPESTSLLVSVWTDKQVQKQLEYSARPQLIWESVARYMNKKGYNVSGKQCRSRMKQVLVCYREAKRAGTKAGVEQYYESIDRVLKLKRLEQINSNPNNNHHGIDTVDSVVNVKSPPKDVKTNKNIQMRYKYQKPAESIFRTEALSPVWSAGSENYPDSPESSETVLAKPFRVFSPVRDAATNTTQQQLTNTNTNKKILQQNVIEEAPIKESYRPNTFSSNYFNDVPFQNTVQNVQNQIIQENMQQNQAILQQNLLQNQVLEQNRLQMNANVLRQNIQNTNQGIYADPGIAYCQGQMSQMNLGQQNLIAENVLRMQQNNCQLNRAMPQEPRKTFRQNLAANHRPFQDINMQNYNPNLNPIGFLSPSISPDIPPNLNEAFCQQKSDKANAMSEQPYTQIASNPLNSANPDMTTVTNNATFNDDTISIEFLQDSPSPDEEPVKLKDFAVNTEEIPNAPFRKKKAEKLERLMMNAINSQTEVVNKILAAQNDMVSRVLDLDRDRQNRLETRIDHLLDVVQNAVLNKSGGSDRNSDALPSPPEPLITNLLPPPKPGVIPPKLDLVPPKPCRVPCTVSTTSGQPVNTATTTAAAIPTRPGVVSPVMSPSRRVGAIWQKLGPVSTSPFVRAQQQLGFKPVNPATNDARTQSSAERRITKEFQTGMDTKTLIFETENFLEAERHLQEEVENARIKAALGQDLQSRRRLFTQREPSAAMIVTAAFLDAEIQSAEIYESARQNWLHKREFEEQVRARAKLAEQRDNYNFNNYAKRNNNVEEVLLAGQGDSYERLKQLNAGRERLGELRDSSTPAKPVPGQRRDQAEMNEPRQTIQQLAQLVMNSGRWRNTAGEAHGIHRKDLNLRPGIGNAQSKPTCPIEDPVPLRNVPKESVPDNNHKQAIDGKAKTIEWLQERFSYGGQPSSSNRNGIVQEITNRLSYNEQPKPPRTMGFTTDFLNNQETNNNNNVHLRKQMPVDPEKRVGFVFDGNKERFAHDEKDPFEELHQFYIQKQLKLQQSQGVPWILHDGKIVMPESDAIERYVQESKAKPNKDTDSDNDEEFLDTTATMPSSRKSSLTSSGSKPNCIIS